MQKLYDLITETNNLETVNIDRVSTIEMLRMINNEDKKVAFAVEQELEKISVAVDKAAERLKLGGRMFYFGAGTSGRLGIIDASECNPTYGTPQDMVQGIIAGGYSAIPNASMGDEDNAEAGEAETEKYKICEKDVVVGIAASGRTPYVLGAVKGAIKVGALTVGIANNKNSKLAELVEIMISPITGAEVIQGSTRMKAGTSQKMVLNMLSTGIMIKLGKVYKNLMVDVVASNEKLYDRAKRIVVSAANVSENLAEETLRAANYEVKTAIVMLLLGKNYSEAKNIIEDNNGYISKACE